VDRHACEENWARKTPPPAKGTVARSFFGRTVRQLEGRILHKELSHKLKSEKVGSSRADITRAKAIWSK